MSVTLTPRLRFKPPPLTKKQRARLALAHRLNEQWRRKKQSKGGRATLDPTHVQEVIWRYAEKKQNLQKIATRFGCHPRVIRRVLKENNVRIRRHGEHKRLHPPFTPRQEQNIVRFYTRERLLTKKIAAKYGCSPNPIYAVLRRHNVPMRSLEREFNPADNKKMLELLPRLRSAKKIAKATGYNASTVRRWLAYDNLKPLPARKKIGEKGAKTICYEYTHNKVSTLQLAKRFRCSPSLISRFLRQHGVALRRGGFKPKFTERQRKQICDLYLSGMDTIQLGQRFSCCWSTICHILESYGIPRRPQYRFNSKPTLTEEQQKELCELYRKGLSCGRIAPRFNISSTSVHNYLERHNVLRRPPGRYKAARQRGN